MFHQMRRKDRQLTMEETKEILKKCEYGILSMVGENGYGYGVPLNYAYVNNAIYFHGAKEGFKLDSLKMNNNASFCVVSQADVISKTFTTKYESAIVFGKAEEVTEEEKGMALLALIEKYSPEYLEEGKAYIGRAAGRTHVFKIVIEEMTGKSND